jgi:hypothetical protein
VRDHVLAFSTELRTLFDVKPPDNRFTDIAVRHPAPDDETSASARMFGYQRTALNHLGLLVGGNGRDIAACGLARSPHHPATLRAIERRIW